MVRALVKNALEITAPYQEFDEINSGLPEHRRTRGEKAINYFYPAMENTFQFDGGAVYHLYV